MKKRKERINRGRKGWIRRKKVFKWGEKSWVKDKQGINKREKSKNEWREKFSRKRELVK